jgi:RND family efflux transporter MFP subunit
MSASESRLYIRAGAGLLILLSSAAGCKRGEAPPPPPPTVTTASGIQEEVVEWDEYPGHLVSPGMVSVSSRVSGLIVSSPFDEGALVNKGDVLFVIDDRPFKADLQSKNAEIAKAESSLSVAEVQFKRYEKIRGTRAISAQDYDQALAAYREAQSQLAVAKAAAEIAKLNLEWTRVTAPISGRVGRKIVTDGNLVTGGQGQSTLLTTITSVDPMYNYASISEGDYLKYQTLKDSYQQDGRPKVPCEVKLQNETGFPHSGIIDFVDNRVDPNIGALQIRCVVKNSDGRLTSGLYTRMRIPGSPSYHALLVPDSAVGTDQNTRYVLVVRPDQTVESRAVTLGALFGNLRVISQGLKPDEKIVINGLQFARPGAKVAPVEKPFSLDSFRQASHHDPLAAVQQFAMNAAPSEKAASETKK